MKNNTVKTCIYCKETKPFPSGFSKEHVISKLFGVYSKDTMTLVGLVCIGCNQYFANNLELHLGRDSTFGLLYRERSMNRT